MWCAAPRPSASRCRTAAASARSWAATPIPTWPCCAFPPRTCRPWRCPIPAICAWAISWWPSAILRPGAVRLVGHRFGAGPLEPARGRLPELHPDRRFHQSRQLGRRAGQPERRAGRHQHHDLHASAATWASASRFRPTWPPRSCASCCSTARCNAAAWAWTRWTSRRATPAWAWRRAPAAWRWRAWPTVRRRSRPVCRRATRSWRWTASRFPPAPSCVTPRACCRWASRCA